jgi:hypothetical protein
MPDPYRDSGARRWLVISLAVTAILALLVVVVMLLLGGGHRPRPHLGQPGTPPASLR